MHAVNYILLARLNFPTMDTFSNVTSSENDTRICGVNTYVGKICAGILFSKLTFVH